jgi:hypothetical protein
LILIVYFNLLGAQIPVLNNLQSWQLHDCLGSIEFCSNQCGSYDDKPNCCIVCDLCHSHVCQWFRPMQLWSRNNCKHMFCHCQKFCAPSMQAQTNSSVLKPYASKNGRWPPYVDSHIGGQQFRSSFLGTNLDRFEPNWILELDCTLVPSLILGSSNQKLSFSHCFLVWNNQFSLQNSCHIDLASICHFLVSGPHLKAFETI